MEKQCRQQTIKTAHRETETMQNISTHGGILQQSYKKPHQNGTFDGKLKLPFIALSLRLATLVNS